MATYCIADIHGCLDEFALLLVRIDFNPSEDMLYVLGDVVDRGTKPLDCLRFIMQTPNVNMLMGNHERSLLNVYGKIKQNPVNPTTEQLDRLSADERDNILQFIRERPLYEAVTVNGVQFFLSHAGFNADKPLQDQTYEDLLWNREEFYGCKALDDYICIFGHTPTIHRKHRNDCSVWVDTVYNDKINIDCGCVFGGALAALRLDDGAVFYVKSKEESPYVFVTNPVPVGYFYAKRRRG